MRGIEKIKTDHKLVYFSSFRGKGYSDSPRAIYEAMLKDNRFKDYMFVWTFNEPEEYQSLENDSNTKLVKRLSEEETNVIKTAGYWITECLIFIYQKKIKSMFSVGMVLP